MITLIKMELRKILKNRFTLISVVLLLILSGVLFTVQYNEIQPVQTESGTILKGFAAVDSQKRTIASFNGRFNDETVRSIAKEYLEKSTHAPVKLENKSSLEQAVNNSFLQGDLYQLMENPQKITKTQAEQLMKEKNFIPVSKVITLHSADKLTFGFFTTWRNMITSFGTLALVILLIVLVEAAQLFSNEYALKADQVILTTRFGRTKWSVAKLIACTLFSLGLLAVFMGLNTAAYGIAYGFSGWDTSIQLNLSLQYVNFPWLLTNLQMLLLSLLLWGLAILFTIGVTSLVSALLTKPVSSLVVGLLIFIGPIYVKELFGSPEKAAFMNLFPALFSDSASFYSTLAIKAVENQGMVFVNHMLFGVVVVSLAVFIVANVLTFFQVKRRDVVSG